jgi:micrococcal nuclease
VYTYRAEILRVVDADTLHVQADLGIDVRIDLTIRLHGLDAPEAGTEPGVAATAYTVAWLADAPPPLMLITFKDRRERYGRYLGRVIRADGRCLNDDLLASGHARPWTP